MSYSINANEPKPRAKGPILKPLPKAQPFSVQRATGPLPDPLSQDRVRFGGTSRKSGAGAPTENDEQHDAASEAEHFETPEIPATDATASPLDNAPKNTKTGAEKHQPKGAYGQRENNLREAARIVLCDIAPLALSVLPLVGIPGVGLLFAIASLPMSYAAGHLGRHIAKHVDSDQLNPVFQYIHHIKKALTDPTGKNGNVVDSINKATDDLLNVRNMPAIFSTHLLPLLKVHPDSRAAKILTKMNGVAVMRAEVNLRLAQAENGKEAGKAVFAGVKDFAIYSAMNKLGAAMVASSVPGAKLLGEFLKNAAWVKIAADLMSNKEAKPATTQGVV
jgi:hypothetical protein